MNSDKLDKYFKEQIDSLDTVPVPGTNWNREASWAKIDGSRKQKKVVFWWYLSGVAAIVVMFIAFWFSGVDSTTTLNSMAEQKIEAPSEIEVDQSGKNIFSNEAVVERDNKIIESNATHLITAVENYEAENKVPKNFRQPLALINPMAYLPQQLSINHNKIQFQNPKPKKTTFENPGKEEIEIAFNRTYVIRSKSKDVDQEKSMWTELKLRIDLAMNSEVDPPSGILSNRSR